MVKAERIAAFFGRLTAAAASTTAADAFALITSIFVAVEDELCMDPDDRMFPPSGNFHFEVEGREDLVPVCLAFGDDGQHGQFEHPFEELCLIHTTLVSRVARMEYQSKLCESLVEPLPGPGRRGRRTAGR